MKAGNVQANVMVPAAAKDVMSKIGARLRDDPAFADRLVRLLETPEEPRPVAGLPERVQCHEERIRALESRLADVLTTRAR